ncbi:MAG: class I SAM-dependent methyltransferase [Silvanigrellaceae bacterium]|nr:class I SAM-dependent methyltransferase [Silvanigrellaceae bacterium]
MHNQIEQWPIESELGLIQTMNGMGIMTTELSPVADQFVHDAKVLTGTYLDIGAAYGVASHKVLENGVKLIACDISNDHLDILYESAPSEYKHNLTIDNSSFPYETDYQNSSMNGILISLVLHFLDGETIKNGLNKCYEWLKSGGKVYITVMTPNLSFYKKCWPIYKKRISEGVKWPGIFVTQEFISDIYLKHLPAKVHLFDQDVLTSLITEAGFKLIYNSYFCYKNFPEKHRNNGKEFLGIIGVK